MARTDPTGRVFVSYRHTRLDEVRRLVRSLRLHGVPTWQDERNLGPHSTEDQVRAVLADPATSGAVVWISPDAADSEFVCGVEVPAIVARVLRDDGFTAQLVAAGGLAPAEAGAAVSRRLGAVNLRQWNVHEVRTDPVDDAAIAGVTRLVLQQRLAAVHERLAPAEPLSVLLDTWRQTAYEPGHALELDWSDLFDGRLLSQTANWSHELAPALRAVGSAVPVCCPGRTVRAGGKPTLSVAVAAGHAFRETTGVPLVWSQQHAGRRADWSLTARQSRCDVTVERQSHDPSGSAVALLVSAVQDVEPKFADVRFSLPSLRGVIHAESRDHLAGATMTSGQASRIAWSIRQALREARATWGLGNSELHVFAAVPVGLAMLIGQVLNTWEPITVYEDADEAGGYTPSLTIGPVSSR